MNTVLLIPPIAFLLFLALMLGMSALSKRLAAKGGDTPGKTRSYACGEVLSENQGQPEYSQFFKFAFFFTIIHVVALVVATDPQGISVMSALYLFITVLSLFMLFRR